MSDAIAHRNSEGLDILRQLENKIEKRGVGDPEATYKMAQAYAALDDKVSAIRVFRKSVESGFFSYPYFKTDPLLDGLRTQAEFDQIMKSASQRHEAFKSTFF